MHAYAMHFASESLCGDAVSAIELNWIDLNRIEVQKYQL